MARKHIPVPSDFSKPRPGTYLKKEEGPATKTRKPKPFKSAVKAAVPGEKTSDRRFDKTIPRGEKSFEKKPRTSQTERPFSSSENKSSYPKKLPQEGFQKKSTSPSFTESTMKKSSPIVTDEKMPLNKFIAHCGICSRRDAVELIKKSLVKVNDTIITEPGFKVSRNEIVFLEGKQIVPQVKLVYYLLNKPKDFITTTEDPEGRKTVLDLFSDIEDTRIYPVGRLDRNTTGLLLLTNDGELAQKLSHPKNKIKKVYQVVLGKPLTKHDYETIVNGVTLEDGPVPVDDIAYINPTNKKEIGIEIHVGRNRIVRRLFEHLNYQVKALDRVVYAGLTKKNIPRGKWRELEPKEIIFLKHFTSK